MSIAAAAIQKKAVTYFGTFLVVVAGFASFFALGQLEDPDFSVKTAVILTSYPGASPEEVELEVTDRIETKLQELKQLKWLESYSRPGLSYVKVEIQSKFWGDELQPIWEQMRRKIREIETQLPPGTGRPLINDDFGDVFGFQLALTGDGFSYADLERYAKEIRRELSVVEGVARVDLWGVQEKVIYIDVLETQLSQVGLSDESMVATLRNQNMVVDAGELDLQRKRFRIAPTGAFRSPQDIGDLTVTPSFTDALQSEEARAGVRTGENLIRISDIGRIRRGYREPPTNVLDFSTRSPEGNTYLSQPAIGLSITNVPGANIVQVGRNIDARLDELVRFLPVGINMNKVHWQSDIVDESVTAFLINFAQALGIVLVVLTLAMGWRMGVIVGTALFVTVLGTFIVMAIAEIDLHRISLGALIISLGMMVDNAIVVADGMVVRMQQGMDRVKAAVEAATRPAIPLLGATIIAVMAFFPISGSPEDVGEYCQALFQVAGISLLISWIVSLTITPLQCVDMLPDPKAGSDDPFAGGFYQRFRGLVIKSIRFRWLTIGTTAALLVVAVIGFGNVKQLFFPASSMPKFMIDYFAPEGTRIEDVRADLKPLEAKLIEDPRVEDVAAYIGSGPPRFYLPVEPEEANQAYGQLIVNVVDSTEILDIFEDLEPWIEENMPEALTPLRLYGVGPSNTWQFEIRLSGPAVADPRVLRELAQKFTDILDADPLTVLSRTDWMQRVQKIVPEYNTERGRFSGVTRENIAVAMKRAYDGIDVGLFREGDDLIPIVLRHVEEERRNIEGMPALQVRPTLSIETLPLAQVTDSIDTEWEESIVRRRDRRRTIKIQANPVQGATMPMMREAVLEKLEAIELPPEYRWEWDGEWESTVDAQASLLPGMVPAIIVITFLLVYLYNAFRPLIIILLTIPLVLIGITPGLLIFDAPFGFMALLGTMSLAGMMTKNIIVLLDEAESQVADGKSRYDAILMAAVSRLRPVLLAAGTTVLGVIPLLPDVFWVGMAIAIMSGLTVGTVLTMIFVPTLYAAMYRLKPGGAAEAAPPSAEPAPA